MHLIWKHLHLLRLKETADPGPHSGLQFCGNSNPLLHPVTKHLLAWEINSPYFWRSERTSLENPEGKGKQTNKLAKWHLVLSLNPAKVGICSWIFREDFMNPIPTMCIMHYLRFQFLQSQLCSAWPVPAAACRNSLTSHVIQFLSIWWKPSTVCETSCSKTRKALTCCGTAETSKVWTACFRKCSPCTSGRRGGAQFLVQYMPDSQLAANW